MRYQYVRWDIVPCAVNCQDPFVYFESRFLVTEGKIEIMISRKSRQNKCIMFWSSLCPVMSQPHETLRHLQARQDLICPDSKVHGANMRPIWGRQEPGGPHVGPMNLAIWVGPVYIWDRHVKCLFVFESHVLGTHHTSLTEPMTTCS